MGWIKQGGNSGVAAILSAGIPGSTSVTLTLLVEGGTLISWSLQQRYRESNQVEWGDWSNVTSGITNSQYNVTNLSQYPAQYEFKPVDVVGQSVVTGNVVSVNTTELPPVTLTSWAQIDGGDDLGSNIAGGEVWFWNNNGPATFEAIIRNRESAPVDAIQLPVETTSDNPGQMIGFAILQDTWDVNNTITTPSSGTFDSPGITLTTILELSSQIAANGGEAIFQQELGVGIHTPGKNFGDLYHPETGNTSTAAMEVGSHLGSTLEPSGIAVGPFAPKMYIRLVGKQLYTIGMFGDSTVGMVQPLESSTPNSKEGVWFWANENMRSAEKSVRAYSYGQGTASWDTIKARVRAHLETMTGKISRVCIQVWTWNSAHNTTEQAEAAWLEYLDLEDEVKAAGFACSPLILHPYTTKNEEGQIAAFEVLKAHVQAHSEGLWLDEITGSSSWPNLPSAESEDNVHQNQLGSKRCAIQVAQKLLSIAAIDYPELA